MSRTAAYPPGVPEYFPATLIQANGTNPAANTEITGDRPREEVLDSDRGQRVAGAGRYSDPAADPRD